MLDTYQRHTGTRYTATVALLVMALVASPVVLLVSRPLGYGSVSIALTFTLVCCALAKLQWARHSELTIPSIVGQPARTK